MLAVGGGICQRIKVIYIHHMHLRPKAEAQSRGMEKLDSTFWYTSQTAETQIGYTLRYAVETCPEWNSVRHKQKENPQK